MRPQVRVQDVVGARERGHALTVRLAGGAEHLIRALGAAVQVTSVVARRALRHGERGTGKRWGLGADGGSRGGHTGGGGGPSGRPDTKLRFDVSGFGAYAPVTP